jgi:RimJ/RimL family protein N-acetyltransferase
LHQVKWRAADAAAFDEISTRFVAQPTYLRSLMTTGIQLRDVTQDDLPIFFEHQMDPVANRMAAFTPRNEKEFFARWARILADQAVVKKAILFNGQVAGSVVSFERDGDREVGYWIGREHWGKGIATTALSEFVGHVNVRPLYAHVAKDNVASIRVLEKCGFTVSRHIKAIATDRGEEVEEVILKLA